MHNAAYVTQQEADDAIMELRHACRFRESTLASLDAIKAMPSEWWVKRVKLLLGEFDSLNEAFADPHPDTEHNEV